MSLCLASAQPSGSGSGELTALRSEVRRLASELLKHRIELTEWKMQWLRAELQHIQAERQRLTNERQLAEREISELNQASTNSPGAENDGRKEELTSTQLPALLASEQATTSREAVLVAALNAESLRHLELRKETERLRSTDQR